MTETLIKNCSRARRLLDTENGVFLTFMAEQAGLSRQQLSELVKVGVLERPSRGVYIKAGEMEDQLFAVQRRAKKIIYSHETALFLHGMTDRTPFRYAATVPSSYKPSAAIRIFCDVYYIKHDLVDLGKCEVPSGMGHMVIAYNPERTLCDIIRSRNRLEQQTLTDALKKFAARKEKDLNLLSVYAKKLGVSKIVYHYMEVLL